MPKRIRSRLKESAVQQQRYWLLAAGICSVATGVGALFIPHTMLSSTLFILGVLMIAMGLLEVVQWILGRGYYRNSSRGAGVVFGLAALYILLGALLIAYLQISVQVFAVVLGLVLLVQGATLLALAWRLADVPARGWLVVNGLATAAVGVISLVYFGNTEYLLYLGYLLGGKLILFGFMLVYVALFTSDTDTQIVFGAAPDLPVEQVPGEVYAVYYGPAFHCGVHVGDSQVVDYLGDNKVRLITWEQFLLGRKAQLWRYPDLPKVPAQTVIAFARSMVGQEHPYKALTANCETFAIYCKSGGQVRTSAYSQVALGLSTLRHYPIIGSTLEMMTRVIGWVAYRAGGVFGQRTGYVLRWISGRVTNWLVLRSLASSKGKTRSKDLGR